ncbi:MAG: DUF4491 family protein [Muribaculaceae bacterium]|nr:DUF4491 family protein [Muribaculaceae bacterium]
MDLLTEYHLTGLAVGLATFLIIGIFHPFVIKGYYYFGLKCRWWFAVSGVAFCLLSLWVSDVTLSTLCGVTAFSCFWSIKEVSEQAERVRKGWFPGNPRLGQHADPKR